MTTVDEFDISKLDKQACHSWRKHEPHLVVQHMPGDAPDEHFRCPGRAEDE